MLHCALVKCSVAGLQGPRSFIYFLALAVTIQEFQNKHQLGPTKAVETWVMISLWASPADTSSMPFFSNYVNICRQSCFLLMLLLLIADPTAASTSILTVFLFLYYSHALSQPGQAAGNELSTFQSAYTYDVGLPKNWLLCPIRFLHLIRYPIIKYVVQRYPL